MIDCEKTMPEYTKNEILDELQVSITDLQTWAVLFDLYFRTDDGTLDEELRINATEKFCSAISQYAKEIYQLFPYLLKQVS